MESVDRQRTSQLERFQKRKRQLLWLQRLSKLAMFVSTVILVFMYLQEGNGFHEKQITRPAALPQRFFPTHSYVNDYMFGTLQPVIKLIQDEELVFVMFYAPWCAQSMIVRNEFVRAAKVLSNTVKFVGINCWHASGECRQKMKFLSYPELFVYHTGVLDGYRFTGIKEAEYMVKFVESFMYPIQPLYSEKQINDFTIQADNTVIGYFDFNSSPQPPGRQYYQFYLAALRVISYDFYQPVQFGLVLCSRLAQFLGITSPGQLTLARVGNRTLRYEMPVNVTAQNITNWISTYRQKSITPWLVPPGSKSLTLSIPIQQGPAVFVFAPVNPLMKTNTYHDMVRLATLAYRSCGNNTRYYQKLLNAFLQHTYTALHKANEYHTKSLSSKVPQTDKQSSKCCVCMSNISSSKKSSQDSVCEYCIQKKSVDSDTVCDVAFGSEVGSDWSTGLLNSCSDFYQFYNVNEHHSVCCKDGASPSQSDKFNPIGGVKRKISDPFVINGENIETRQYLNKLSLQKTKHLLTLKDLSVALTKFSDIRATKDNFTGLQCKTNKTVNFYFVDSVYQSLFMEKFHVQVPKQPSKASVILVDLRDESTYVLQKHLNYRNLVQFVVNYTEGQLRRHQRSSEVYTPIECHTDPSSVCVLEVTSQTFQEVVMDPEKDVLLLFYSHLCGFCDQVSYVFLSAATYFKESSDIVFARINGDRNDLPWEYTVEAFPTLIFFPAHRKADSILFPVNKVKTLPNLIKFILHHSSFNVQLDTAVNMCSEHCVAQNKKRILERIIELEASIKRLERRGLALLNQKPLTQQQLDYIKLARKSLQRASTMKNFKLRKAQVLNYFLQTNWKKLDIALIKKLIATNVS